MRKQFSETLRTCLLSPHVNCRTDITHCHWKASRQCRLKPGRQSDLGGRREYSCHGDTGKTKVLPETQVANVYETVL